MSDKISSVGGGLEAKSKQSVVGSDKYDGPGSSKKKAKGGQPPVEK
jgi:hypothetical protein